MKFSTVQTTARTGMKLGPDLYDFVPPCATRSTAACLWRSRAGPPKAMRTGGHRHE